MAREGRSEPRGATMRHGSVRRAVALAVGIGLVGLTAPAASRAQALIESHDVVGRGEASAAEPSAGVAVSAEAATTAVPAPAPPADDLYHIDDDYYLDDDDEAADVGPSDPLEPANRAVFAFNRGMDTVVLDPLTRGYQWVVPESARHALFRAFRNLNSPATFANDVLQLRFKDAGKTLGRFILNTTLGAGGLFDAGIEMGWEHHESDFGQTLGSYGVGAGPYLVLPLLGPSTLRDGFGSLVDGLFQPLTYIIGPGQLLTVSLPIGTGRGFTMRDKHYEQLKALEDSSIDFYAAMRSAYLQSRRAHVAGHGSPATSSADSGS